MTISERLDEIKNMELLDKPLHVYPINDLADHLMSKECSCKPTKQKDCNVYIHNAWDMRECTENQTRVVCAVCARQIVSYNASDQYVTPMKGSRRLFGNQCICGECAKDLDENGVFPEEKGR